MREQAQVVIIGGGAMGAGLLYFLAHEGWTDTVLIEKGELSSGSTWHAAGLIPHFIGKVKVTLSLDFQSRVITAAPFCNGNASQLQ